MFLYQKCLFKEKSLFFDRKTAKEVRLRAPSRESNRYTIVQIDVWTTTTFSRLLNV